LVYPPFYGKFSPFLEPTTHSLQYLYGMNAVWLGLMIPSKQGSILLPRVFVMYLYITLQHKIGLNSLIEEGFNFLGTRVIIVALTSLSNFSVSKKDFTAGITSSPTIGQAAL
jgi:hypothetical protein